MLLIVLDIQKQNIILFLKIDTKKTLVFFVYIKNYLYHQLHLSLLFQ